MAFSPIGLRGMGPLPIVTSRNPVGAGQLSSGAVLEAPAFVAGLDDVAVMGEAVEQRGGHFRIAEDARPFSECEIGRDDDRGALVEATDQVEQQLAAGLGEWEIAQFVEDDEVESGEIVGETTLSAGSAFGFEAIDEVDG